MTLIERMIFGMTLMLDSNRMHEMIFGYDSNRMHEMIFGMTLML